MEKIPIAMNLQEILSKRFAPVAFVDEQGKILGTYVPKLTEDDLAAEEPWPTGEELEAMAATTTRWYTTDEVLAHLRSLG